MPPRILFVSHGAPTLPFEDGPARHFLATLGESLGRPRAILCISAHWETDAPQVTANQTPDTIHDFFGFPEALYRLRYPVAGSPGLAHTVIDFLNDAGFAPVTDPQRGLDHGAWNPLMLIYPKADIPVVQLSIQPNRGPDWHMAVGEALFTLPDDDILILGSGGAVHNLRQFRVDAKVPAAWAIRFDDWLAQCVEKGDSAALLNYHHHPDASRAHPSADHFLPLFVALGAARGRPGHVLHRSFAHGSLSMSSFAWADQPFG